MGVSCKVGAFNTGTGAVDTTLDVTCGFQPKAIIFWWSGITDSTDACTFGNSLMGIGFATQSEGNYQSLTDDNGAGSQTSSTATATIGTNCIVVYQVGTTTLDGAMAIDSFANWPADGFRVKVTNTMPVDLRVGFWAIGGTDITDVDIIQYTEATPTYTITTVGFQADVIFFLSGGLTLFSKGELGLGISTAGHLNAFLGCGTDQGSASADTAAYCGTEIMAAIFNGANPQVLDNTSSVSAITSNGFDGAATAAVTRRCMAIKGGLWKSGTLSTRTDSNGISISGLGGTPKGVMVLSANRAQSTSSTPTAPLKMSIGAATSTTERHAQVYVSQDGSGNMRVVRAVEHDELYINVTAPGSDGADGASGTVEGLMDVSSVDADGYTFVMDDTDSSAFFATYVMVGETAATGTNEAAAYLPPMPRWSPNVMYAPCT